MATINIKNPNRFINPNILDNWYFLGGGSQQGGGQLPVNTRGQTSYASAVQYTIDRWKTTNANTTVAISSAGLTISGSTGNAPYLAQPIENIWALYGKKVTLSVLTTNGLKYATATLPNSNPTSTSTYATIRDLANILYTAGVWYVRLRAATGGNETFIAVKLELGDTQTLCANVGGSWVVTEIPQYGEERMRCFRSMADSADEYSYNPNAPIWSKTVDADSVMSLPADVTIDKLISIYEESQGGSGVSMVAIPYKTTTTPETIGVRVYSIDNEGKLVPLNAPFGAKPKLTFVYRL